MLAANTILIPVIIVCVVANLNQATSRSRSTADSAMEVITRINNPTGNHPEPGVELVDVDIRLYASKRSKRAALRFKRRLWPNGEIPYYIEDSIKKRPSYVSAIHKAMREWEKWTCIKFKERTTESAYARFYYGRGCSSYIGRYYGQTNDVSLGRSCGRYKVVLHELGHVIGFFHEHSRPDRDKFVQIVWDNILPRFMYSFRKVKPWLTSSRGVKYDYHSIMHYGMRSFSKNGRLTIRPRDPSIKIFGGYKLSELDKQQVNLMYNCQGREPNFPEDFSWQKQQEKNQRCLRVFEPRDPYWRDKYLCYNKFTKDLGLIWSHRGRITGMDCTKVRIPFKPYWTTWNDNYLCTPKNCIYRFYWSAFGRRRGMSCAQVRDDRRMKVHYLCAKSNKHFGQITHGSWSRWSKWSRCSKTCGGGVRKRRRKCYYSGIRYGGRGCQGKSSDHQRCSIQACTDWPLWKSDFAFGAFKRNPPGMTCLKIYEQFEYYNWNNYYFCWKDKGKHWNPLWSDSGRIPGMRCTQIYDATYSYWWRDNFLCFPQNTPYRFQWSVRGPIEGSKCIQWKQASRGWEDNYLCANSEHECPTYWTSYRNEGSTQCYLKIPERRSWSAAQRHCEKLKGHLLSITSWRESHFIWRNVIGLSNVWIGLNDRWQEGTWLWSDGRPVGYTNWDRGDPNDGGRHHNEDCVMIKSSNNRWNDFPCDTKFQYMCKITLNNSPFALYRDH